MMTFLKKNIFASLIVLATTTAIVSSSHGMDDDSPVNTQITTRTVKTEELTKKINDANLISEKGLYSKLEPDDKSKETIYEIRERYLSDVSGIMQKRGYTKTEDIINNSIKFSLNTDPTKNINMVLVPMDQYHMTTNSLINNQSRLTLTTALTLINKGLDYFERVFHRLQSVFIITF